MKRRTTGCVFVAIAAFLYAVRFLAAAIYVSNMQSHGPDIFQLSMSYVGSDLHLWAFAALIMGVVYLVLDEWNDFKSRSETRASISATPNAKG
jgi:hypothetical protein